ncbi:MAG: lysoplasmalogenase [Sandarakinorhabdus sp.]|nr:lysoplasmalogenase [Sandarakinorhabdus sp.]
MIVRKNAAFAPSSAFTALQVALILASLVTGLLYPLVEGRFGPVGDIVAKGSGVAALAVAGLAGNQRWIAAIMAAGAAGDVLLELPGGLVIGGGAFAIGHAIAIYHYTRHRRPALSRASRLGAAALLGYGAAMPLLLMPAGAAVAQVTLYSLLLCGMAAAALLSRFPRQWLAAGALLFVISDTLLIMRLGGHLVGGAGLHGALVWYFYYLGQFGIFVGVAGAAGRRVVAGQANNVP